MCRLGISNKAYIMPDIEHLLKKTNQNYIEIFNLKDAILIFPSYFRIYQKIRILNYNY